MTNERVTGRSSSVELSRRRFVELGAFSGLAATAALSGSTAAAKEPRIVDKPTPEDLAVVGGSFVMGRERDAMVEKAISMKGFDDVSKRVSGAGALKFDPFNAIVITMKKKMGHSYPVVIIPGSAANENRNPERVLNGALEIAFLPEDDSIPFAYKGPLLLGKTWSHPFGAKVGSPFSMQFAWMAKGELGKDSFRMKIGEMLPARLTDPANDFFAKPATAGVSVSCAICLGIWSLISAWGCYMGTLAADAAWAETGPGAIACSAVAALLCVVGSGLTCAEACKLVGAC